MPELPEVETIVRGLKKRLENLEFSRVEVRLEKCLRGSRRSLIHCLKGRRVLAVQRRGKNIIFRLSDGLALFIHLGMTGRLRILPPSMPEEKHTHVVFSFRNHSHQLRYVDPRQFGRLFWEKERTGGLNFLRRLGPEPLEVSPQEFSLRAQARHRQMKSLLLDQSFLAGVGNIYADESLHRAGIHPRRKSDSLGQKALSRLHRALQQILLDSIRDGGTSVRSYVDCDGSPGGFQKSLSVYGREGEPCCACRTTIIREKVGGRSSFYCPRCQPEPRCAEKTP